MSQTDLILNANWAPGMHVLQNPGPGSGPDDRQTGRTDDGRTTKLEGSLHNRWGGASLQNAIFAKFSQRIGLWGYSYHPRWCLDARNERFRPIAFQNIKKFWNQSILQKVTADQSSRQNRKLTCGVQIHRVLARKSSQNCLVIISQFDMVFKCVENFVSHFSIFIFQP